MDESHFFFQKGLLYVRCDSVEEAEQREKQIQQQMKALDVLALGWTLLPRSPDVPQLVFQPDGIGLDLSPDDLEVVALAGQEPSSERYQQWIGRLSRRDYLASRGGTGLLDRRSGSRTILFSKRRYGSAPRAVGRSL